MRMPVAPPLDSGVIAERLPLALLVGRNPGRRAASDAQATPLHSSASTPALFQPARGKRQRKRARAARPPAERRRMARFHINTTPVNR